MIWYSADAFLYSSCCWPLLLCRTPRWTAPVVWWTFQWTSWKTLQTLPHPSICAISLFLLFLFSWLYITWCQEWAGNKFQINLHAMLNHVQPAYFNTRWFFVGRSSNAGVTAALKHVRLSSSALSLWYSLAECLLMSISNVWERFKKPRSILLESVPKRRREHCCPLAAYAFAR